MTTYYYHCDRQTYNNIKTAHYTHKKITNSFKAMLKKWQIVDRILKMLSIRIYFGNERRLYELVKNL